jgi:hypothetical protein
MTTVKAYFPTWLIFIGSRPRVYNLYLGLLSLLFLGYFYSKNFNFGQYIVAVQLFSSEEALWFMTLQSSMRCSVVIFHLRAIGIVIQESFLRSILTTSFIYGLTYSNTMTSI